MIATRKSKHWSEFETGTTQQLKKKLAWNGRILVVDDEPEIGRHFHRILDTNSEKVVSIKSSRSKAKPTHESAAVQSEGFEVVVVQSYEDALTEIRKSIHSDKPFALGFFDVVLKGKKDGFDLVKEIQNLDKDIYAVFVTAYNDRSIDSIDQHLGLDKVSRWDYLNKPFAESEILQKARSFVSLWNLEQEKHHNDLQIAEIQKRVLESERNSSVSAVSRGIGHELGNILMQIMGKADISLNKEPEDMRKALSTILDACDHAGLILDRFKGLNSGRENSIQKIPQSLGVVLDESIELLNHQFENRNIKICKIRMDQDISAPIDSTSLLQVIVNLSMNAMDAMNGAGQIDFSLIDHGDTVELLVRDYGPGISADILGQVQDAFFTTKGEHGTGLGLALVKEIIEIEHEGTFTLKNHEVKGLEISARIPKTNFSGSTR